MSNLYAVISELCEAKGVTGYRLCKDVGISPSVMTDLKMGRKKGLSADYAEKIASYFGVSVGFLLGNEQKESPPQVEDRLSKKQKALIAAVAELPDDMVSFLLVAAKDWLKNHKSADSAE